MRFGILIWKSFTPGDIRRFWTIQGIPESRTKK